MTGLSFIRAFIALILFSFTTVGMTLDAEAKDSDSSNKLESKYFRHLMFRETPWASYRGIYPISSDVPPAFAHYQFDYDAKGRLVRIRYQINNDLINDNQVWDSFIWFAPSVEIKYENNHEIHTYYNLVGEQVAVHGDVYTARYTLDESGKRTALHFYNKDGQPSQNAWNIHRYEWRYNETKVNEKRFNLSGMQQPLRPEFEFFEVDLEYDHKGQLVFIRNLGTSGEPTNNESGAGIDRIVYDQHGNFVRWQVYDKDGNPVEGNRPMVHVGEHLYDRFGNKVGLRGFDRYGKQIPFSWGAYEHVYTYNAFGNQISSGEIDPNGEAQTSLVSAYTDDQTKVKAISAVSAKGEKVPSPALGGAAHVEFTYDESGQRSHQLFNADGSPFRNSETSNTGS